MAMANRTDEHLAEAFAMDSKLSARIDAYALRADRDGDPFAARLFRAVSETEAVHARRYLRLMRGKIGSTDENIERLVEHELKGALEAYENRISASKQEDRKVVEHAFKQSRGVIKRLIGLIKKASGASIGHGVDTYFVCQICGNIESGECPGKCPVCGAIPTKFKRID